jgi:hypothetical protein
VDGVLLHHAAVAAYELGLYGCLAAGPLPTAELAARLSLAPRVVEMLGGAAESFGLLVRSDGSLSLTPAGRDALLGPDGGPSPLMGFGAGLLRSAYTYGALLEALRSDGPRERPFEGGFFGASLSEFAEAMHEHSVEVARRWPEVVGLGGHRRLLDVGGGSGTHAIAAVRAAAHLSAVVLEKADMAGPALARVAKEGLERRIEVVAGEGEWPEADLHLLSDVLHDWREADVRRLLARSRDALAPGGRLVVLEVALRPGRPECAAVVASGLSMLLLTGGQQYSGEELEGFLRSGGSGDVETGEGVAPGCATLGTWP